MRCQTHDSILIGTAIKQREEDGEEAMIASSARRGAGTFLTNQEKFSQYIWHGFVSATKGIKIN
jgi:hypothetical protein